MRGEPVERGAKSSGYMRDREKQMKKEVADKEQSMKAGSCG